MSVTGCASSSLACHHHTCSGRKAGKLWEQEGEEEPLSLFLEEDRPGGWGGGPTDFLKPLLSSSSLGSMKAFDDREEEGKPSADMTGELEIWAETPTVLAGHCLPWAGRKGLSLQSKLPPVLT